MYAEDVNNIDPYMRNLRDSLKRTRDTGIASLDQQRRNNQAQIMSQANKAGMMYSNIPARAKVQYDTESYYPAVTKLQNTYQTGINSLRNQGVNLANQIRYYEEQTNDLNEYANMYNSA